MSPLDGFRDRLDAVTGRRHESSIFPASRNSRHGAPGDAALPARQQLYLGESGITPYLGLRARLSQVWINRWTVLTLLIMVRVLLTTGDLRGRLEFARAEALVGCSKVEDAGSVMASMPHYMSAGANELAATGVTKGVHGLMQMLSLAVSGMEEIIVFMIHLLTSTWLCLITLVVGGSAHVALKVAQDASDYLNRTLADISGGITKDVNGFKKDLTTFVGALNSVPKLLGSKAGVPDLNIDPSLSKLKDLKLPSSINEDLQKLNSSIPTFEEVQNFTDSIIRTPFEKVKTLMNDTLSGFSFDQSIFPVPPKRQLTFCSDNDRINKFFKAREKTVMILRSLLIVAFVLQAVTICVPMAHREIWKWRNMQRRSQMLLQHAHDPMDVVQIVHRPYSSWMGIKASSRLESLRGQVLVRWAVSYATSGPMLFLLLIGAIGLANALITFIVLKVVQTKVPEITGEVGDFAGHVVNSLNDASKQWAVGANGVIETTNQELNAKLLSWAQTTTGGANDTLNIYMDKLGVTLNATFGGTPLMDPVKKVLDCLVELKVVGIQKGIAWVSSNAHITLPELPADMFSAGAAASLLAKDPRVDSFLAQPGKQTGDALTSGVFRVMNAMTRALRTEALISLVVVLVWLFVALLGVGRAVYLHSQRGEDGGAPHDFTTRASPLERGKPNGPWDVSGEKGERGISPPAGARGYGRNSHVLVFDDKR